MSELGLPGKGAERANQDSPVSTPPTVPVPKYPRRAHRKSRTGCEVCKRRKVKCDERHPACLNCITHGVKCPFLTPKPPTPTIIRPSNEMRASKSQSPAYVSPISPPVTSPSQPSMTPVPAPVPERDDLPMLELELLHNFTTQTYSTLAADPGVCDFWRVNVVQMGLQCDYIMRAILAISALHLAYHRPDRRDFYTAQGILLHQRASRSAVRFIAPSGVHNVDDAVNLFTFSMLTIYFALASPRHSLADGSFFIGDASSSPSLPDWTFLVDGAKSFSRILGSQGHSTLLAPFLAYGHGRWNAARDTTRPSPSHPGVTTLRERILAASPAPSPKLLAVYSHALDELELALVARQSEGMIRDVLDAMIWVWAVADSLVPLLKGSNTDEHGSPTGTPAQEAVAIFAHFSILLRYHDSHWWLQGWAEHLISRAWEILDEEHRSWIEWPMNEIGWVPPGATRES